MTPRKATTKKEKKSAKKRKKQKKGISRISAFSRNQAAQVYWGGVKNNCRECRKVHCYCHLQENH